MEPELYVQHYREECDHPWFVTRREKVADILSRLEVPGGAIIEVGCGTGENLRKWGGSSVVIGGDFSRQALQFCRARGISNLCLLDAQNLPFRSETVSVVLMLDILEHISRDWMALQEAGRVLKSGGSVIFTGPAHPWLFSEHDRANHHFRRYRRLDVARLATRAGLRLEMQQSWMFILFPAVAAFRLFQRIIIRGGHHPHSDLRWFVPSLVQRGLKWLLRWERSWFPNPPLGLSWIGLFRKVSACR